MQTRTIVLFGGPSDERHVSVAEAQHVAAILKDAGCWYWAPDGAVHDVPRMHLLRHEQPFTNEFVSPLPPIASSLEAALDALGGERPAFFITLAGVRGEDGTVQQLLAQRRLPFNGSGAAASGARGSNVMSRGYGSRPAARCCRSRRDRRGSPNRASRIRRRCSRRWSRPCSSAIRK